MSKLSREDYTIENYKAIYDYYREYKPSEKKIRFAANAMRLLYNPVVTIDEAHREQVAEHVEQGLPIIYAINHLKVRDNFVVGAAAWAVPELGKNILQGLTIPAKLDYFTGKSRLPLPMSWLEALGMIPIIREKDCVGKPRHLQKEANKEYIHTSAHLVSRGINLEIAPEGGRNTGDPNKLLPFKYGLAKIALEACELGVPPMILPSVTNYTGQQLGFYRPRVHYGKPIFVTGDESAAHIIGEAQHNMQRAVDVLAAA